MLILLPLALSVFLYPSLNGADTEDKETTIQGLLNGNKSTILRHLSCINSPEEYIRSTKVVTQFPNSTATKKGDDNRRTLPNELLERLFAERCKKPIDEDALRARATAIYRLRFHVSSPPPSIAFSPTKTSIKLSTAYGITSDMHSGASLIEKLLQKNPIKEVIQKIDPLPGALFKRTEQGPYVPFCLFPITHSDGKINGVEATVFNTIEEISTFPNKVTYYPKTNAFNDHAPWSHKIEKKAVNTLSLDTEEYNFIITLDPQLNPETNPCCKPNAMAAITVFTQKKAHNGQYIKG